MIRIKIRQVVCLAAPKRRIFLKQTLLRIKSERRGFVVAEDDAVAPRRAGKQVLKLGDGEAAACARVAGDTVAVIGENRKLAVFPLSELPEMPRGRGVKLQSYREGGLSDVTTFALADGLSWKTGAGSRTEKIPESAVGKRAQAGRAAMRGFPRSNRFGSME